MTSVSELRNIALKARGENSNGRLEQYIKARDEAFDLMTDGVMDRIKEAARNGKFRYPIYRWMNTPRFQKDSVEDSEKPDQPDQPDQQDDTKVFFGNSSDGKNGLYIMSLINPKGIDRQNSLITKLREFFNSGSDNSESANDVEHRDNQLKVYFEPHPVNFRKCAIFVSWDRKQVHRPSFGGVSDEARKRTPPSKSFTGGSISEHFSSLKEVSSKPPMEMKRFATKGLPRSGYVKRA
jgi:hypothetical protein